MHEPAIKTFHVHTFFAGGYLPLRCVLEVVLALTSWGGGGLQWQQLLLCEPRERQQVSWALCGFYRQIALC